jgi:hypothetical protein
MNSLGSGLKTQNIIREEKDKLTFFRYPNANVNVSWLKVFAAMLGREENGFLKRSKHTLLCWRRVGCGWVVRVARDKCERKIQKRRLCFF